MEQKSRSAPKAGFAIIAVVVLALVSYGGYQWYQDEFAPDDDEAGSRSSTPTIVELKIEFKGENHTVHIKLYETKAPHTCANFRHYVNTGYYNETIFHRIIAQFVVQGGGMDMDGNQKQPDRPPLKHEPNDLSNSIGTVSMARTEGPDTATSQFFFNVRDNSGTLNPGGVDEWGYVVFGVVKDPDEFALIRKISNVPTDDSDNPIEPVLLHRARVV